LYFRLASGDVVFYDGEKGRIVVSSLVYPNGILLSPSKEQVYVALTTNRQLQVYERKDSDGLRLIDTIDAKLGLDNIGVDTETGAVYLAGHPQMLITKQALHDPTRNTIAPSKVVKITNNTAHDQFYGKKYLVESVWADDGSGLSLSSQALVAEGKTIISGIFSRGVMVCNRVL
jgi:arylesterase / paraoxonase